MARFAGAEALTKPYAALTVPEKWQWHAAVYAFRRATLGISRDEKTSPCDPDGIWFDERLIDEAERRLHNQREAKNPARKRRERDEVFDARDVENQWARQRGYNDFEHYKEIERLDHVDACVNVANSFINSLVNKWETQNRDMHPAAALGVTATEITPGKADAA